MSRKSLGDWGEALAADYLRRRGWEVLARQYRCRFGEVDLIARQGRIVCFVEVKTRTNLSLGLPREYVDRRKRERLRRTAACFLAELGEDWAARFDVAEVYTADDGLQAGRIEYIENAF